MAVNWQAKMIRTKLNSNANKKIVNSKILNNLFEICCDPFNFFKCFSNNVLLYIQLHIDINLEQSVMLY